MPPVARSLDTQGRRWSLSGLPILTRFSETSSHLQREYGLTQQVFMDALAFSTVLQQEDTGI